MRALAFRLEPWQGSPGFVHARAVGGPLVCSLRRATYRYDEVLSTLVRAWAFPVTCLWCLARLARARWATKAAHG